MNDLYFLIFGVRMCFVFIIYDSIVYDHDMTLQPAYPRARVDVRALRVYH